MILLLLGLNNQAHATHHHNVTEHPEPHKEQEKLVKKHLEAKDRKKYLKQIADFDASGHQSGMLNKSGQIINQTLRRAEQRYDQIKHDLEHTKKTPEDPTSAIKALKKAIKAHK